MSVVGQKVSTDGTGRFEESNGIAWTVREDRKGGYGNEGERVGET